MYDDDDVRIGRLESYKKIEGAGGRSSRLLATTDQYFNFTPIMQFTQTALAAVLAIASSAAASPLAARQSALQNWQVSSVYVGTPSGRPGSYPWATISANVVDPNEISLGPGSFDGSNVTAPAGSQGRVCLQTCSFLLQYVC
jgi:hypothetical protein